MATFPDHSQGLEKPLKARGKASNRSEEELAAMTTPDALRALAGEAGALWESEAPARFKTILASPKLPKTKP